MGPINGTELATPPKTSEITARHDELGYQLEALGELIDKLYGKLGPVLRNEPGVDIKLSEDNSSTDMGQFLGVQINRVVRANASLRDILDRSEL